MNMGQSCTDLGLRHVAKLHSSQIGLGSNLILDTITVPTEIVLWQSAADRSRTKCLGLSAGLFIDVAHPRVGVDLSHLGGDLACFTVERKDETGASTMDLLVCGNGQWGGLGNNLFSNAQGTPVRAKNISGLSECWFLDFSSTTL